MAARFEIEWATPVIPGDVMFTLREMLPADLDAAEDKLYKATAPITLLDHQRVAFFDHYKIHSAGPEEKVYEVIRFQHFAKCTCPDFEFSSTGCKHIALCMPKVCRSCYVTEVGQRGTTCAACQMKANAEAMETSPLMPRLKTKKPEKIGSVRI